MKLQINENHNYVALWHTVKGNISGHFFKLSRNILHISKNIYHTFWISLSNMCAKKLNK